MTRSISIDRLDCMEAATSVDKGVLEELSQGRQYADQLRAMMLRDDTSSTASASFLVEKILHAFTHSLSLLRSEDSQAPRGHKDRRGCYKRRKTWDMLIKETTSLVQDGHAWRKYGQKVILNAKHPRNYYRCTHKFDQGCQATKQVQKIQDDPFPLFKTTYLGNHTCSINSPHQIITDMTNNHHDSNSVMWSFDSLLGDGSSMIKPECSISKSEEASSSSLDASPHHCNHDQLRSAISSDYAGDVYSCATATTHHHDTIEMNSMISFDEFLSIFGRN